jgi:hypothetical protein
MRGGVLEVRCVLERHRDVVIDAGSLGQCCRCGAVLDCQALPVNIIEDAAAKR